MKTATETPKTPTVAEETATDANNATVYNINAKGFKIICKNCKSESIKKSPQAKFCGNDCRNEYHRKKVIESQTQLF